MDGQTLISNDLKTRREGANLGFDKWGMHALSLINISEDDAIIDTAAKDAMIIVTKDKDLSSNEFSLLRFEVSRVFES